MYRDFNNIEKTVYISEWNSKLLPDEINKRHATTYYRMTFLHQH